MPFEEEEGELPKKKEVKQVSSQKSIFDSKKINAAPSTPKKFEEKVQQIAEKNNNYKAKAGELAIQYKKLLLDKTLQQNKNVFSEEIEREVLTKMINLAIEINNDEDEQEGMGSLGWITLLLKYQFSVRDRLNDLEYQNLQLRKEIDELKKKSGVDENKKGA